MKILFLDVDGVLNHKGTKERVVTKHGSFISLDAMLVKRLQDWLRDHPDVKIVLSSSWREDTLYDGAFTRALHDAGINWISETPRIGRRGVEIAAWLDQNDCSRWAILDDDGDMHPVGKFHAQTSAKRGLEDKHLKKIAEWLDGL